jgi:signal transduction histidine kinase
MQTAVQTLSSARHTKKMQKVLHKLSRKADVAADPSSVAKQLYEQNLELSIRNRTLSVQRKMYEIMNASFGIEQTAQRLAYSIAHEFKFKGVSISLIDKRRRVLKTIASANGTGINREAKKIGRKLLSTELPFKYKQNIHLGVIRSRRRKSTDSLYELVRPLINKEEAVKFQEIFGVQTFVLYPIIFGKDVLGILTISMDKTVGDLSRSESEALGEIIEVVAIALERAQIFVDLRTANKKLKELDKMKDDFVSVASHELRTPMTAIKSYLWMTLAGKGGKISAKQKFYLDRAYNSTDRLIKLVNDMLNISRIESGRITINAEKVELPVAVREVIEEVGPRAEELKLKVSMSFDEKTRPVLADKDKIKEVLFNLIGNSLKFTPEGGSIVVSFSQDGDRIITNVKDTGRGLDKNDMPTLFTKFGMVEGSYATNKKASGTGLGLYISKAIIEMHGGRMDVTSEGLGKGAVFSFSLPVFKKEHQEKIRQKNREKKAGEVKDIIHSGL